MGIIRLLIVLRRTLGLEDTKFYMEYNVIDREIKVESRKTFSNKSNYRIKEIRKGETNEL